MKFIDVIRDRAEEWLLVSVADVDGEIRMIMPPYVFDDNVLYLDIGTFHITHSIKLKQIIKNQKVGYERL